MLSSLALLVMALAIFDCYLTRRRMTDYGLWIELNPAIKWLTAMLGKEIGPVVGVILPIMGLILALLYFHSVLGFGLLIGFRARLFYNQWLSLRFEKKLKTFRSQLTNELPGDRPIVPPPQEPSQDDGSDTRKNSSKDDNA